MIILKGIQDNKWMESVSVIENNFRQVVYDIETLKVIESEAKGLNKKAYVHLKIETGTNRQGIKPEDLEEFSSFFEVKSDVVLEVGAFEVNGKGTILLASSILKRNPGLTQAQIEEEVLRTLGQKKVIWLKEGLAEDPLGFARITGKYWGRGAGGHTDEFVRFVNHNTILLAWVD